MKSLIDHIEDVMKKQTNVETRLSDFEKLTSKRQEEVDNLLAELTANQEYTACLIEMQSEV